MPQSFDEMEKSWELQQEITRDEMEEQAEREEEGLTDEEKCPSYPCRSCRNRHACADI